MLDHSISPASFYAWLVEVDKTKNALAKELAHSMVKMAEIEAGSKLEEHLLIKVEDVLCNGVATAKYRGGGENYGLTSSSAILQEITRIAKLWEGIIDVDIFDTTVVYTIHKPQPGEKVETVIFAQCVHGNNFDSTVYDEHFFMAGIMQAVRNGRKPLNSLSLLADEGYRLMDRKSATWCSAIGS